MNSSRIDRVAEVIEAYLATHPEAADSVEGIARWWVGRGGVEAGIEDVQGALEQLVEAGSVQARTLPDGERVYSATPSPRPGRH